MKVNYYVDENHTLKIYVDNAILAEISDVMKNENLESFVEDILYGLGYLWNQDGTLIKI